MTGENARAKQVRPKNPRALDDIDRRLVRLLVANGRMSNSRLALGANIAESTAHTRVSALVDSGVIRGFHADVNLVALGAPVQSLILVKLKDSARPRLRDEAHRLAGVRGVLRVLFLTGQYDLAVTVAASDPSELRDFVVNELSRHPEIAGTETCVILEDVRGDWVPFG
ncbi:Lrp/AsnC family transcriptional regulator [Micropruina sonneratiae]|uniref:Lrp/AsnC family transcriptional regulator n=1 Tax=Micropruina sonneratiae TaxID=2986940 RepID=UPI002226C3D3|nr:Lrp/AsnC family transcriptional regulator [Micropruina sp. KQZ13P-5]MCW3158981.1 Lrp/AsnC family transcriptional regulator [Micropruina sp. KQZ13P-5]